MRTVKDGSSDKLKTFACHVKRMRSFDNRLHWIARVQRELVKQAWWGSLPWTWQDKSAHLDARAGRGSARAVGRGSPAERHT